MMENIEPKTYEEWLMQFPIWDEERQFDDVTLCPNCKNIDMSSGERVCYGCRQEKMAHYS